jgi:hypothetical protein
LRVSITAAPAAAPATAATAAAEAKEAALPCSSTMRGYCSGGVTLSILATWWIGLVKPTPFSVQPMQGWPQPTGQLFSPASPKPRVEQLA